jgi:peroxiredoxin Q/BCP
MLRLLTVCALLALLVLAAGCLPTNHEAQVSANETYLLREGIAALKPGDPAPALDALVDAAGQPVHLATLLDQHKTGVLLFFFPAPDTPNSSTNLIDWDKHQTALSQKNLGAYAVCPTDAATAAQYAAKLGLTLPLLADPTGSVATAYGCLSSGGQYPQRTTVGVGPQSSIIYYHRGALDEPAVEKAFGLTPAK